MAANPRYSVVIPVYLNEASLVTLVEQLDALAARLPEPLEAVFVVDGSPDASLLLLRRVLAEPRGFSSQLIALSRNFGSFSAIRAGLAAADGEYLAVSAADLQEPPELLERFFDTLAGGECDVVVGVRQRRDDPWLTRVTSRLFWRLYRRFIQAEMPARGIDVFGCTRQVVAPLLRLSESHTSLVGLLLWVGFRRAEIAYDRLPRAHGRSAWSMRRRVRYLLDSVFSFSDLPVHVITAVGVIGVFVSTVLAVMVTVAWAVGSIDVAGYTPIMLAIAFTSSAVLLSLGIIGSYVWRSYENTKGRPHSIPMSAERFPAAVERVRAGAR